MKTYLIRPLCLVVLGFAGTAHAKDPAARGLDLFIHAPEAIYAGAKVPVQVRVFGFPSIARPAPLPGATVELAWDPEHVGEADRLPPPVQAVVDQAGRGHLAIAAPAGQGNATLLVAARYAGHERTRSIVVARKERYGVDLRASDDQVVPGGKLSAWVTVTDLLTGKAAARTEVVVGLKDGEAEVFSRRLATDGAGMTSVEIPVPATEDPDWTWTLAARVPDDAERSLTLRVREEVPQTPRLNARFTPSEVPPGQPATGELRLRDATDRPLAKHPLRYLLWQKGLKVPKDDREWLAASTLALTDIDGVVRFPVTTPRTIPAQGSQMQVLAKAQVEGVSLEAQSVLSLSTPRPEVSLTPEFGVLIPGIPQRLLVQVTFEGSPLVATVALAGHALAGQATTNERGLAMIPWAVPEGIGAFVPGDSAAGCAGSVAATVTARFVSLPPGTPAVSPVKTCLGVNRDAVALVRPARSWARAGESLPVRVLGKAAGSASVVMHAPDGLGWSAA